MEEEDDTKKPTLKGQLDGSWQVVPARFLEKCRSNSCSNWAADIAAEKHKLFAVIKKKYKNGSKGQRNSALIIVWREITIYYSIYCLRSLTIASLERILRIPVVAAQSENKKHWERSHRVRYLKNVCVKVST